MCIDSGLCEMKSKAEGDRVGLLGVDEVGELDASRMKKTPRLLPTRSQLPSSV
jgi:hypothetical protein